MFICNSKEAFVASSPKRVGLSMISNVSSHISFSLALDTERLLRARHLLLVRICAPTGRRKT